MAFRTVTKHKVPRGPAFTQAKPDKCEECGASSKPRSERGAEWELIDGAWVHDCQKAVSA